jgi:hypothetical protein
MVFSAFALDSFPFHCSAQCAGSLCSTLALYRMEGESDIILRSLLCLYYNGLPTQLVHRFN